MFSSSWGMLSSSSAPLGDDSPSPPPAEVLRARLLYSGQSRVGLGFLPHGGYIFSRCRGPGSVRLRLARATEGTCGWSEYVQGFFAPSGGLQPSALLRGPC